MLETTAGLPYATGDDAVSALSTITQALAEGIARPVTLPLVMSSGWTLNAQNCWGVFGDLALLIDLNVTYTGATISTGVRGNITDTPVCTINDTFYTIPRNQLLQGDRESIDMWQCMLKTGRTIEVTSGVTGASLSSGNPLSIQGLVLLK